MSLMKVRDAIRVCEKCATINPSPIMVENDALVVKNNWDRLVCDVNSKCATWKSICSESSSERTGIVKVIFRELGPPNDLLLENDSSFKFIRFLDVSQMVSVSSFSLYLQAIWQWDY